MESVRPRPVPGPSAAAGITGEVSSLTSSPLVFGVANANAGGAGHMPAIGRFRSRHRV